MRRNAIKKSKTVLDEEQTKDAVKVLQKYAQQKYRNSILISPPDLDGTLSEPLNTSPIMPRAHSMSRQQTSEHYSAFLTTRPSPISDRPPLSPAYTTEFITDHSVRDEIKREKRETWCQYFQRVSKYFYSHLGLNYILMIWIMLGYACLGGYLFMLVELPNEKEEEAKLHETIRLAASSHASLLSKQIAANNCSYSLPYHREKCHRIIMDSLRHFHSELTFDVNAAWKWSFWNSVFYAATVFTTIGYGNLTCKTTVGRLITIIYGMFGIPLMLYALKVIGDGIHACTRRIWILLRKKIKQLKKCYVRSWKMRRTNTIESVSTEDILTGDERPEDSDQDESYSSLPLTLVLIFVILFMILCSTIVSFWEQWDYFTSFYFFFVSLSTIGFGDIIPQHPKYACLLFGLYFLGLALFSMVYAILQERVENKYMWALTLIDQMYSDPNANDDAELQPTPEIKTLLEHQKDDEFEKSKRLPSYKFDSSVKFRSRFTSGSQESVSPTDRPNSEYRFSVIMAPGNTPKPLPPALSVLMAYHGSLKHKQLVRSDSSLSKLTQGSLEKYAKTPSASENLTPNEMSLSAPPWNMLDAQIASPALTTLGPSQGAVSAPSLGRMVPLSVIAEVSDEDALQAKQSSRRKFPHPPLVRLEAVRSPLDSLPDDKSLEELNIPDESPGPSPSLDPDRPLNRSSGESRTDPSSSIRPTEFLTSDTSRPTRSYAQPPPSRLRRLEAQDIPSPTVSPSQLPLLTIQRASRVFEEKGDDGDNERNEKF